MKHSNLFLGLALLATAATTTSCTDNPVLSARQAKRALNKETVMRDSAMVQSLTIGFYEVKTADIERLGRLEAAGMIDLKVMSVTEYRRERVYDYWRGYSYFTMPYHHYFADVQLTPEGTKYLVTNPPRYTKEYEKDFPMKVDNSVEAVPEWMNFDVSEYLARLEGGDTDTTVAGEEEVNGVVEEVEEVAVDTVEAVEVADDAPVEDVAADDTAADSDYDAVVARVNSTDVSVLVGKVKIVKVKNIFCPKEMADRGEATCQYIIEFYDKTPFGFVFDSPRDGERAEWTATLRRYEDAGWRIKDVDN